MSDTLHDLETQLTEIIGADLAESLVKAAKRNGEVTLDLQLAMNDGLENLTADQRRSALHLLDRFRASLG